MEQNTTLIADGTQAQNKNNMINITPQETKANNVKAGPGRTKPPAETMARRAEVLKAVQLTGGYGLPIKELASRHGVAERIIYKDVEYLLKTMPVPNVSEIGKKFKMSYETVLQKANKMMFDSDKGVQKDGAELLLKAADSYTTFLERYGYKMKTEQPSMVLVDNRSITVGLSEEEREKLLMMIKDRSDK